MKELIGWVLFALGGIGLFVGLVISLINYSLNDWDGCNVIIWTFICSTLTLTTGVTLIFINDKIETKKEEINKKD
ncbi:MAG: hypothetical protein RR293_05490 [Bacteroidales bacterium]